MDCTGKFPVRSLDGMVTMFIMYDWSSNSILAEPIENTKDEVIQREDRIPQEERVQAEI